jgi:hypothetical protein
LDCSIRHSDYVAGVDERPPLLVKCHGGPTSSASSALNLGTQFWTSRGIAVLISGGSAGGYTTLAALTFRDFFQGGASYYGVSDAAALAGDTHKFESRYLDWLIGPYPQDEARYRERSPVHHADRLSKPVIFAGQTIPFVLTHAQSHLPTPDPVDAQDALRGTQEFWEQWASTHQITGMYADAVSRSLITLKALTYAPTGGIVAAPTTSLPEQIGGSRNWDYRFCWLRDATLTLLAFMNAGYYDEARYWRDWLLRAAAGSPSQIQTMYGLAGEKRLAEWEVPWLSGYEGSKPVRIGNAASDQLQIDVFGEVMDALHLARVGGLQDIAEGWDFQRALLSHLEKVWSFMDDGIWEVRGERQHFTHSKAMAWVAFDRAIKSAEAFRLMGPIDRWRDLRAEIHTEVCERAFNRGIGAFVQAFGSDRLDASTLLIPAVGFLPPDDARVQGTIARQSSAGSCPMGSCCGTIP